MSRETATSPPFALLPPFPLEEFESLIQFLFPSAANLIPRYASSSLNSFTPHTLSVFIEVSEAELVFWQGQARLHVPPRSCRVMQELVSPTKHATFLFPVFHTGRTNRTLWEVLCIHKASVWFLRCHRGFYNSYQRTIRIFRSTDATWRLFLALLYFRFVDRHALRPRAFALEQVGPNYVSQDVGSTISDVGFIISSMYNWLFNFDHFHIWNCHKSVSPICTRTFQAWFSPHADSKQTLHPRDVASIVFPSTRREFVG